MLEKVAKVFEGDDRFFVDVYNRLEKKSRYVETRDFADAIADDQPNRFELDSRDIDDMLKKHGSSRKGEVDINVFTDELKRIMKQANIRAGRYINPNQRRD